MLGTDGGCVMSVVPPNMTRFESPSPVMSMKLADGETAAEPHSDVRRDRSADRGADVVEPLRFEMTVMSRDFREARDAVFGFPKGSSSSSLLPSAPSLLRSSL